MVGSLDISPAVVGCRSHFEPEIKAVEYHQTFILGPSWALVCSLAYSMYPEKRLPAFTRKRLKSIDTRVKEVDIIITALF